MTFLITLASTLVFVTAGEVRGNDAVTIPLDEVWGYRMPGTKDIVDIEPNSDSFKTMLARERIKNSLVTNTRWRLNSNFKPKNRADVGTAFVVPMIDLEALKEANAIIAGEKKRAEQLPAGQPLTLVFYSFSCGRNVRLDKITKSEGEMVLEYHFHIHGELTSSPYFALIPIGIFPPGNVNIKIKRLPETEGKNVWGTFPPLDAKESRRIVCDSFVFKVIDTKPVRSEK